MQRYLDGIEYTIIKNTATAVLTLATGKVDRLYDRYLQSATEADAKAQTGYECLTQYAHFQKGMRKPAAAEFAEALRQWPRTRFQALTYRQLANIYRSVRDVLAAQLAEVVGCKQRLEGVSIPDLDADAVDFLGGSRRLMPPGCPSVTIRCHCSGPRPSRAIVSSNR